MIDRTCRWCMWVSNIHRQQSSALFSILVWKWNQWDRTSRKQWCRWRHSATIILPQSPWELRSAPPDWFEGAGPRWCYDFLSPESHDDGGKWSQFLCNDSAISWVGTHSLYLSVLIAVKLKPINDQRAFINCVKAGRGKMQDAPGAHSHAHLKMRGTLDSQLLLLPACGYRYSA